jgi:hypothetical protein
MMSAEDGRQDIKIEAGRHFLHLCSGPGLDVFPAHQPIEHVPLVITHEQIIAQDRAQAFFLISQFEGEKGDGFQ